MCPVTRLQIIALLVVMVAFFSARRIAAEVEAVSRPVPPSITRHYYPPQP